MNFENRSTFAEVMIKDKCIVFMTHLLTLYKVTRLTNLNELVSSSVGEALPVRGCQEAEIGRWKYPATSRGRLRRRAVRRDRMSRDRGHFRCGR